MPTDNSDANETNNRNSAGGSVPMPKHIPFPDCPGNSELLNELIMFLFMTCAAIMQFINIYRTIWWLPNSYINNIVNFYQIEPYLIVLIILMASRRLLYCVLLRALELTQRSKQQRLYREILKYGCAALVLTLIVYCIVQLQHRITYISFFLLIYPFIVYLLIFGFKIEPFLRSSCVADGIYFNGMPMHSCTSSPTAIRDEIETLKNDFNNRFKQAIYTSVVNAYYAGFVPCFFAGSVYYNVLWASQHIVFIWFSGFMMCTVFMLPSKYSDILHRSALHLGHWCRLELRGGSGGSGGGNSGGNNSALLQATASTWNKNTLWPHGSVVKHSGELFRSQGTVTVALPGNSSHLRFFKLFHNPAIIYMVLTAVQASIVITQLMMMYFVVEWHFILSISFITLTNQFSFFKITRDYLITKRIYTAEATISEKQL